jgi:pyruvate dehydrogenase E2 component (dihydrolipoamide acetyltransferase)
VRRPERLLANGEGASVQRLGEIVFLPVVVEGAIKIASRMKATISVDHRVSDGAEGARFLQALAKYIEEPMRLLIEPAR